MVTWRSDFHNAEFGAKTIYEALAARAAQAGIAVYSNAAAAGTNAIAAAVVVIGESYFTHGTDWHNNSPWLPDDPVGAAHDLDDAPQFGLLQSFESNGVPTIAVCLLPRPYVLSNVVALCDAFLAVYRPGDEGGPAIAETLFGDHRPGGRLPWQLPRSAAQVGVDDTAHWDEQPDKWDLPYDLGATTSEIAQIRALIAAGEPVPPVFGDPLFQYGDGIQGFGLVDATPPEPFALTTPTDGTTITGAMPSFTWQPAVDPETGIEAYELYVDGALVTTTRTTSVPLTGTALGNGVHSWQVEAVNWAGGVATSATSVFTIDDTVAPAPFHTRLPVDAATFDAPARVAFFWDPSADHGTGIAGYTLVLDGVDLASVGPGTAVASSDNLALHRVAYGSSTSHGTPGAAVDGDPGSRWSSAWVGVTNADAERFTVDLGAVCVIHGVELVWEAAYGKEYLIQVSLDDETWSTVHAATNGTVGTNAIADLDAIGRYVRMQGQKRGSVYGYSLWEFRVLGSGLETLDVDVPTGEHLWSIRATDGAGNSRTNSNGAAALRVLDGFMRWQIEHFGSVTNPAASADHDAAGNGQDNYFKYVAGLDPTNPASVFALEVLMESNRPSVHFGPVWSDRTYRVEANASLTGGVWTSLNAPPPPGNASDWGVADTNPPAGSAYYRVGITSP